MFSFFCVRCGQVEIGQGSYVKPSPDEAQAAMADHPVRCHPEEGPFTVDEAREQGRFG